jgi:hypothetical protein
MMSTDYASLNLEMGETLNINHCTLQEVTNSSQQEFISFACMGMESRFSSYVVTPEQQEAWRIGFNWIYDFARELVAKTPNWRLMPEYSAPLVSGRPDLVIDTGTHLLVIEMKTGVKAHKTLGEKQVIDYADTLWGKVKIGRTRSVIPILLSESHSKTFNQKSLNQSQTQAPTEIIKVNILGLIEIGKFISEKFPESNLFEGNNEELLKYSPRPSVIEAAVALVASLDDKNVITGLSESQEISRVISKIREIAIRASLNLDRKILVVSGSPGAGKTLVGLRIAHDRGIQNLLSDEVGTPMYLTGNGPLVEVLVESLARDSSLRTGISKSKSLSSASAKVRNIHGITEKNLGIECNVIVFDEGQRIWNESQMQKKKRNMEVKSEAEEILIYLEKLPWALAIVLIGEGQEINAGEEGLLTWIKAISNRNLVVEKRWSMISPPSDFSFFPHSGDFVVDPDLKLTTMQRTDNSANVSLWVEHFLAAKFEQASEIRESFVDFPVFFTRELGTAKSWLRKQAGKEFRSGFVASSKSKRLLVYGIDAVSDAGRSYNWANWYLNDSPDLNSSGSLEVAATEYKCQGLELDYVGVCWSWDLVFEKSKWVPRSLNTSTARWNTTKSKAQFQVNAYRVLMTRSRKGLIIWIPRGDETDSSRDIDEMNRVATCFREAGAIEI